MNRLALYVGAPFFAYPHKAFLNQLIGSEYARAYAHFRRDHMTATNLSLHLVCLVFQITNNFALLSEMDKLLDERVLPQGWRNLGLVSTSTVVGWIATLWLHAPEAPLPVKLLSTGFLLSAFVKRRELAKRWNKEMMAVMSAIEMMAFQVFILKKENPSPVLFLVMLAGRLALQRVAVDKLPRAGSTVTTGINLALGAFMLKACQDPFNAEKVPPFLFGLVSWVLSIYTNQPWMCFYGGGFLATLGQGVAHFYSMEEATMPQLAMVGDEYAHGTYFPNLVFQSILHSVQNNL
ncbi:hypothetical protein BASA81_000856 [Batrachochytrium salamandrivorans]|nr:hypothetical protein BASA81_000856 [Batrachochytrium salamandrivorans]